MVFRPLVQQPGTIAPEVKGSFRPFTPAQMQQQDQPDPVIENQNESGIFDGSTYAPGGDTPENQELYNSIGQETLGGFGPRIQQTTNDQGEQRTYFVPRPSQSEQGVLGSTRRIVEGGVLEAAKGTAGFGEWAMDNLSKMNVPVASDASRGLLSVLDLADQLLGTEFSDADKNWIDENFPTLPAQNDIEKMGQEITSVVFGGIGGSGAAGTAGRGLSSLGKKIAELGTDFFRRAKETDLANAAQKTELFISELTKELAGMNVGATIATPTDVDSISGNALPDALPGLSEDETNKVGHMIDNTVISGIFNLVGRPLANVGGRLAKTFLGGGKKAPVSSDLTQQTAIDIMREIDPGLANVSPEEFKRRSIMFSDMVAENSKGDVGSLGTFTRGPVTSTIKGADSYVDKAYGYLKRTMSAEQWETFKTEHAKLITDNIIAMRRDNMSNTIVQSADARINDQANTIMQNARVGFGGDTSTEIAGNTLAKDALNEATAASDIVNLPNQNAIIAQGELEAAQSKDVIMSRLAEAKANNQLGQTPEQQSYLRNLANEQLYDNWVKSYEHYNALFDAVPDTPIDSDTAMEIAELIANAGDDQTLSELTRIAGAGNPIKPLPTVDPQAVLAGDATDPLLELAQKWEGQSLKTIFNEVRPFLSDTLNSIDSGGHIGVDKSGIVDLKRFIDEITLKSDDPSFKAAMDAYKDHMNTFGQIDSMDAYNRAAQNVYQSGSDQIKRAQLDITSSEMLQDALYGNDPSGQKLVQLVGALQRGNPDFHTEELADAVISSAINRLAATSGDTITSQGLINAVTPILPTLETLSPDAVSMWRQTVERLQNAEIGSAQAKTALAEAKAQSVILRANAEKRAAFKFLEDFGDGLQIMPMGDLRTQMNNIFKTEGATRDLMNQARLHDDPMVIEGIKSQYLDYLTNLVFTNTPIAADGAGGFIQGASAANLNRILGGSSGQGKGVLQEIFADTPQVAEDILLLLDEVQLDHAARATRPQTFSSNTAVDDTRRRALNTLITMTLGTLNRTAATTRNIVNNITGVQMDAQREEMKNIMAALLVDSKFLTETLDNLGERPTRDQFEDGARAILEIFNNGSSGTGGSVVRGTTTSFSDRAFNEDEISPERQTTPDLSLQTNEAFGLGKP